MFSYDKWIDEQSAAVEKAMRDFGRRGMSNDVAVYVVKSCGATPGRLVCDVNPPEPMAPVIRFPRVGSRVMAVPYSHLRTLLWNACRSEPICPVEPDQYIAYCYSTSGKEYRSGLHATRELAAAELLAKHPKQRSVATCRAHPDGSPSGMNIQAIYRGRV